jgi:hypothetical protein
MSIRISFFPELAPPHNGSPDAELTDEHVDRARRNRGHSLCRGRLPAMSVLERFFSVELAGAMGGQQAHLISLRMIFTYVRLGSVQAIREG